MHEVIVWYCVCGIRDNLSTGLFLIALKAKSDVVYKPRLIDILIFSLCVNVDIMLYLFKHAYQRS